MDVKTSSQFCHASDQLKLLSLPLPPSLLPPPAIYAGDSTPKPPSRSPLLSICSAFVVFVQKGWLCVYEFPMYIIGRWNDRVDEVCVSK